MSSQEFPIKGAVLTNDETEKKLLIHFNKYVRDLECSSQYAIDKITGVVWNQISYWTIVSTTSYDTFDFKDLFPVIKNRIHHHYSYSGVEKTAEYNKYFKDLIYEIYVKTHGAEAYKHHDSVTLEPYSNICNRRNREAQAKHVSGGEYINYPSSMKMHIHKNRNPFDISNYTNNKEPRPIYGTVPKPQVDGNAKYKGLYRVAIMNREYHMFNNIINKLTKVGYSEKNLHIKGMSYVMVNLEYKVITYMYDLNNYKYQKYITISEVSELKEFLQFINNNSYEQKQVNVSQGADESVARRAGTERFEIQIGGCGNGLKPSDRKRRERSARLGEGKRSTGQGLCVGRRSQRSLTI